VREALAEVAAPAPVRLVYSYAREDADSLERIHGELQPLAQQGVIEQWYDSGIAGGREWEEEITRRLDEADVILLLISQDFVESEVAWDVERLRAMIRHYRKEARVIPGIRAVIDELRTRRR
jgi:TIR domain-containing protein